MSLATLGAARQAPRTDASPGLRSRLRNPGSMAGDQPDTENRFLRLHEPPSRHAIKPRISSSSSILQLPSDFILIRREMSSTKILTASCHCRSVHFTLSLPTSSLPLRTHICNCTICRRTHGALATFHAPLPLGIEPFFIAPSILDSLTGYRHAHATSTKYFCSTCGCHIGDRMDDDDIWNISISIFDENTNANEDVWVIDEHYFTSSTRDGGLAALLPKIGERKLKTFDTQPGGVVIPDCESHQHQDDDENKLLARCHCGGISFAISRPQKNFINSPSSKKWIHPGDTTKWLALIDVCRDCRLTTGAHAVPWLYVPRDHISPPLPDDLLLGTSKSYKSSNGVRRTFCGACGATVFFGHVNRPHILDVAVGIIHSDEGVMLGNWALWKTDALISADDGQRYDQAFTDALTEGLREWGVRTHGEVRNLVVEEEKLLDF
ncbi:Mss4-like protein [Aspergillus multicolor]|uniref:GFA family protein n=1 Tax=Aspergillus multicolor TaxID=41759 RepID=UPI003CCDF2D0